MKQLSRKRLCHILNKISSYSKNYEDYDNYLFSKYINWKINYNFFEIIDKQINILKNKIDNNKIFYRYGHDDEELEYYDYVEEYYKLLDIKNKYQNLYYEYDLDLEEALYEEDIKKNYLQYLDSD